MIRCAIVDDEAWCRTRIARLLRAERDVVVTDVLGDAREAAAQLAAHRPDLLFLDVQMPGLDGFELLRGLPAASLPPVIFVTAHDEHAVRAFEANAVDYLIKPVGPARLHEALIRARARLSAWDHEAALRRLLADVEPATDRLAVVTATGTVLLGFDEIDWIASADNYCEVHAGARDYLVREPLAALEERLGGRRFARIHRRYLVNLDRVRELSPAVAGDWRVRLESGVELRLSRTYRRQVREALGL